MKITIIFPAREVEMGKAMVPVMPLAPTLLAALTPDEHDVTLVDMFYGMRGCPQVFPIHEDLFTCLRTP